MMGFVHACIGAAVGSLLKKNRSAFFAGAASHLAADTLPHKDMRPEIEVPVMAGALFAIGKWRGFNSPEFWGALGGIAPDCEHALMVSGIIKPEQEIFPTHIDNGKYHGPETDTRWSQLVIATASVLAIAIKSAAENKAESAAAPADIHT